MKLYAGLLGLGIFSFLVDDALSLQSNNQQIISWMSWFSHPAIFVIVLLGMSTLFLIQEKKIKWISALWVSFTLSFVVVSILKVVVGRVRPSPDDLSYGFMMFSFPSAHAALAFALIPVLDREFGKLKWYWFILASVIALSRLILNVHFLSDVVWGAIIGYSIGKGVVWWQEKKMDAK